MSIKKDIFAPLASGLGATRRAAVLLLVMMLTAATAWATTTSTINVGGTDYTLFTGFTATAGTEVDNAFVYENMVDGDLSSSFHAFTSPAYVEFNSDDPIIPNGYIFNTYNASSFKPTDWVLKAKANAGDSWTTLSSKSGQSLAYGQEFQYACDNSGNNAYKYFRFEVSNSNNNIWLTEIRLYGSIPEVYYTHLTVRDATCTETGIKQDCYQRNDGKYFTDETGATELAESDVIDPMIPHTCEHHDATDVNIEYWQCSMCSKYFSDEACTTEITEKDTKIYRTITIDNGISGLVMPSVSPALTGTTITLYVDQLIDTSTLQVNNGSVTLTHEEDGTYTFIVPAADVTVTASILSTYSFTLPANMMIVSATNAADQSGKYISGTVIKFVASAGYEATNVSDGTNTLEPDAYGIYTVTVADADINITATTESSNTLYLAGATSDLTAVGGNILIGSTNYTVTIADGANVTLNNATINSGVICAGSATITLVGTNSVNNSNSTGSAGIQIGGSGTTLTIKGDGSLSATGGSNAAGIGLGRTWYDNATAGSVVIESGTITASGDNGIGIGTVGNSKTAHMDGIIIKGGTVSARLGNGYIYNGSSVTIGAIKIYDTIDKVDASTITESVTYMHVENETETDVTATASTYFTIIEDGDRRVITPMDDTDYTITIADDIEHGSIAYAATTAKYGEKITITATPDFGYHLSRLVVKDAENNDLASTSNTFFMPNGNVTVSAVFEQGTHGTTEFAWGYFGPTGFVNEASIYDGLTTVNLQQGQSYQIIMYDDESSYREFLLDNDIHDVTIPYSSGTGTFPAYGNGTDFNNGESGFYDITMTDAGNGKWNVSILKTAGQMDVVPDQTYTGSEITPEPLVIAGSLNLTQGTDYVYSYENNENVGTAKVIATFQGDYASLGSVEKEFTIVPKSVTNNDISIIIPSQEWTGNELTPVITVTDGETELTLNTDYTVTPPSGPVQNASDYTYTITGMGNYAGSREATFTISLTLDPADISVNAAGTEYTIHTAGGWNAFCDLLAANTKGYFSGKTVKLDADIAVSRMAGGHEFTGTFDGDGHTLTLAYGTADAPVDAQFIAPFVETAADDSNQPVFRNLTIDGTIYASNPQAADHYHVGGLIGHLFGDVTIEHCNSLVHITAPGGAGGFVGLCEHTAMFTDCLSSAVITSPGGNNSGFVGWSRASGHAISFDGCTFNGKLLQQDGNGSHNGGFIGWTGSNKTVTFTNCLCAPATLASGETMASGNSATFARGWNATTTATNSYYTQTFGDAQGTKPIVTASKPSNIGDVGTAYNVSGITAYGNGLLYGSDYYCVNSQFGEIALAYSGSSLTATIDGTSDESITITDDIEVNSVTYNRTFTEGKPSTVMLPFSKDVNEISGGTFYTFGGVEKKNDKWEAKMNEVTGSLTANTPYLFVPTGTSLNFTGGATLNTTGGGNCLASDAEGWEFHGTYSKKLWNEVVTHDYGFAATSGTSADDKSVEAGQFVRLTTGASAKPMRCYLSYVGVPNQARALTRGAAATDEELPQSIIVRLVGSNGQTTAIGTIDTKTGEMTFFDEQSGKAERDSEAWYTLDGVRLSGKPTKKGLYINNGKKIVIK